MKKNAESERLDDLFKNMDPILEERVRASMIIAAEIDDEIKNQGWDPKKFHQRCNAIIPAGESNISPMKVEKWLSGTHDFKTSELILLKIVFGKKWLNRVSKRII